MDFTASTFSPHNLNLLILRLARLADASNVGAGRESGDIELVFGGLICSDYRMCHDTDASNVVEVEINRGEVGELIVYTQRG